MCMHFIFKTVVNMLHKPDKTGFVLPVNMYTFYRNSAYGLPMSEKDWMEKKSRLLYLSFSLKKNHFQCESLSSGGLKLNKGMVGFHGCSCFLRCCWAHAASGISAGTEGGPSRCRVRLIHRFIHIMEFEWLNFGLG